MESATYTKNEVTYLSPGYFKFLYSNDLVVDASEGGLVGGPSLAEGGITIVGWNKDAEIFVAGQVAGWQFLINAWAQHENYDTLLTMSNHTLLSDQLFQPYPIPSFVNVLSVVPRKVDGQMITPVLFHGTNQMGVMPRVPTKKNLSYLDSINRAAWLTHYVEKQPKGTMRETAFIARMGPSGQN